MLVRAMGVMSMLHFNMSFCNLLIKIPAHSGLRSPVGGVDSD